MDFLINFQTQNSIFNTDVAGTSWLLAPWSFDPIVGQRALVLYTFGLAIHYFIWLKAIPENRQFRETPNSYREGFKILKKNIGKHIAIFIIGLCLISTFLWMFNIPRGSEIYFALATLHAWIELNFLISRVLTRNSAIILRE